MTPKAARYDQVKKAIEMLEQHLCLPQCSEASMSVLTAIATEVGAHFLDNGWSVQVKKVSDEYDPSVINVIVRHPDYAEDEMITKHVESLMALSEAQ